MLTANKIVETIANAKYYAGLQIVQIVNQENVGEDDTIQKLKYIILTKWTQILQDYYANNFSNSQTLTTPIYDCLTENQAAMLMSKIGIITCGTRAPIDRWILASGFWNDAGIWIDSDTWNDVKPII